MLKNSGEIRIIGETKKRKMYLEMLSNGLVLCNVRVINPFNKEDKPVDCKALIDTGAEMTLICKTIFDSFKTDSTKQRFNGTSTIHSNEEDTLFYPLKLMVPNDNWHGIESYFAIKNISQREYKVIIGVDVLRGFEFVYKGNQGTALLFD